jgi:hypothetical protein
MTRAIRNLARSVLDIGQRFGTDQRLRDYLAAPPPSDDQLTRLVLIGSPRRHGGSLLARLFDGHPDVYAMPLERRFGRPPASPPRRMKNHFPDLADCVATRDVEGVIEQTFLHQYSALRGKHKDTTQAVRFSYPVMRRRFAAMLSEMSDWSRARILDAEVNAFFMTVMAGAVWTGRRRAVVNHCATSVFLPLERVCAELPSTVFVYLARNPFAYYASAKSWRASQAGDELDSRMPHTWLGQWTHGLEAALGHKQALGDTVLLLRYEDLVRDPRRVMSELSAAVGIDFHEVLLRPTTLGADWGGNSSFGVQNAVSTTSLHTWRTRLSDTERTRILRETEPLRRVLGYADDGECVEMEA